MPEIPIIYGGFVIRDYKFDNRIGRPKHKRRLRLLAGIGVLAATFGAVSYIDLGAITYSESSPVQEGVSVSAPLQIPGVEIGGSASQGQVATATQPAPPNTESEQSLLATPGDDTAPVAQTAAPVAAQVEADTSGEAAEPTVTTLASLETESIESADLEAPSILQTAPVEQADQPTISATEEDLQKPAVEPAVAEKIETASLDAVATRWVEHKIAKGESLSRIFSKQGLDARLLHQIVTSSEEAKELANVRPGQKLRFQFDDNNELLKLELHRNRVDSLRVAISDDEIKAEEVSKALDTRVASSAGVIQSSLFVDGQKSGLSDTQIMEMATIFGWDIDFALEIRAGDQFRVLFEEQYLDGEKLRNGKILAAEFTNRGTTHRALLYEDSNGDTGYFDADGKSKRRAFIRTPIKFARVSSRFNPRRWHPVLKRWRSHKGVDYAAPRGTPVKATGNGRVVFRGKKSGYGNVVIVEHANKYTTLYAHLNGFSKRAKNGNRVKQGQVIGYVGSTGLATGPHLHYEFRVHGQHRDPLKVKLPKSLALPNAELAKFRKVTAPLLAKLEAIPADTMVASASGARVTP